jgi:hypothetical protein
VTLSVSVLYPFLSISPSHLHIDRWYICEPLLGDATRGYHDEALASSFTHWTWCASKNRLLVTHTAAATTLLTALQVHISSSTIINGERTLESFGGEETKEINRDAGCRAFFMVC